MKKKDNPVEEPEKTEELKDVAEESVSEKVEEEKPSLSELDEAKQRHDEVNDKYLRLYSEFDNFRKRTQKEKLELYKTAGEDILTSLLPVLDDFERAQKAMKDNKDPEGVVKGIDLIQQKMMNTLTQKGLKPMESSIGQPFDIEVHEAITRIPAPDEDMKGKVIDEVEKGYMLHDKVIRYAKVVVGE